MNVREIALKALYEIEFKGAYSNIAVKKALSGGDITQKDRALFTNIVYGVTDKKLTLDYYISHFSKIGMKKISKYILIILRMGIYQILFSDKIPESAAVNESVKLAKRYGHGASAGFVNGILRSVIREKIEYPSDKTEYLSVKYSFPMWLCEKWIDEFGFDFTEDMMKAFEVNKKITLRANTLKTTPDELVNLLDEEGIKAEIIGGAVVCEGFNVERDELYKKGFYTPQDTAAMQAAIILDPQKGDTVIDMCGAPGGKTTHIAELMKNIGKIYAFDKYEHKIELIRKNAQRLGIDIIEAKTADACEFKKEFEAVSDRVLCDVPCSGLGIIGRKPDIKWNREEVSDIEDIQKKILENGAKYVKDGGVLVYSTCTIEKSENENITDEFIENNKEFEKLYEKTFYPHIDGTDGFYICKMQKNKVSE